MALQATPRVEVEIKASRICYLSGECPFRATLFLTLQNSETPVVYLKDGVLNTETHQSINSDQVIQCFDSESGEQIQVLRQDTVPKFLQLEPKRRYYAAFTTSSTAKPYELSFDCTMFQLNRKYKIRFIPTASITHWPAIPRGSVNNTSEVSSCLVPEEDLLNPSTTKIAWDIVNAGDTVTFETRNEPPKTPNVTVSLTAPSTFSLSRQPLFTFTLTFSTDASGPIIVLAERGRVQLNSSDVEVRDPISGVRHGPDLIDDGNRDGLWEREEFLRIDKTYTEQRKIDLTEWVWELAELKVGEEYILRYLGGTWRWWSEDTLDEVMTYYHSKGSLGLGCTDVIRFAGGEEQKFRVVE